MQDREIRVPRFLPGLPTETIEAMLRASPGKELGSGKFDSLESSSALAANGFGRFVTDGTHRDLPALPGVPMGAAEKVRLEAEMRFPWAGGRHPWLDVAVTTATTLVGIESKRYEPFRPAKTATFSDVFGKRDWGAGMARYDAVRKAVEGGQVWSALDAVQLVKHAYGLRTQGEKRSLGAVLVYLYAEPPMWRSGKAVDPARIAAHRAEVEAFATAVAGDAVVFRAVRWADVLAQWAAVPGLAAHAAAVTERFGPLG